MPTEETTKEEMIKHIIDSATQMLIVQITNDIFALTTNTVAERFPTTDGYSEQDQLAIADQIEDSIAAGVFNTTICPVCKSTTN